MEKQNLTHTKKGLITYIFYGVLSSFSFLPMCFGQQTRVTNKQQIVSWLQQNTIPVKHLTAGNGFADLQPLKAIIKDVKVVSLGESTHGTREMFQVKHRLLEFLVMEMGFTAFALEASYAACQPINEYVLHGKGDLSTVLTGQGYVVWDTQEMGQMIEWLRAYNQTVAENKKVKFYGLDTSYNQNGRVAILNYLRKVAPQKVSATDSLFRAMAREEFKWPKQIDSKTEKVLQHMMPSLLALIDDLNANKDILVSHSSLAQFDQALLYATIMKQWLMANSRALRPPFVDIRSISMAENLLYLLEWEGPEAKFVVWEHNSHISRQSGLIGNQLQKKYRDKYYAFSIEFNQGPFQTRVLAENGLGDLKKSILPPAPVGSLPWYLSQTKRDNLILDLRALVSNPVVSKWLHSPHTVYLTGWFHSSLADCIKEVEVMRQYDGIIFIDCTTPTRPTANALKTASKGEGV